MSNPERSATLSLRVSRVVRVAPEQAFAAWTDPKQIVRWWGPSGVTCPEAHIDLRVGGEYRIANRFPDGRIVWISGIFEAIEPPRCLTYSWHVDILPIDVPAERVTVRFEARPGGRTEIIVVHERIPDDERRTSHMTGWSACLDGLVTFVESDAAALPKRQGDAQP